MVSALFVAFCLGLVAGLRSLMAPAVLLLARHVRVAGAILAVLAAAELIADTSPMTPARTAPGPLVARILSGAFCGWFVVSGSIGIQVAGVVAGVLGALVGTYGGYVARLAAIERIGAIPAALAEDIVAIGLALFAVTH